MAMAIHVEAGLLRREELLIASLAFVLWGVVVIVVKVLMILIFVVEFHSAPLALPTCPVTISIHVPGSSLV